ncbi:MAG: sugar transporter substrate-binding protein [Acidimicrobiaceae bacterium]|jgi:simple sugar transport system substrate-binding protein|nr:sugar transporter substrate-binding protein [Acidimicrobiaceae bacterium]
MANNESHEVSPRQYEVSRRRFLRNAGMAAASMPLLGGLAEILTERGASAQTYRDSSNPLFASHKAYRFSFINHVTTNTFFTATQYGIADAATICGIPTPQWTGSQNSIVSQMVTAMDQSIAAKVSGIAVALIDPTAFNTPTDRALSSGIPVVSYNADEPGNHRMAYIGQSNLAAGAAAAARIVKVVPKGGLVGMVIATPGSGNLQPRINGALPIFKKAGLQTEVVNGTALQATEITAVQSWYEGHKNVKFLYGVDGGDSIAVATLIAKNNLKGKVGGSGWDVAVPTLQQVKSGALTFTIDQQAYLQGFIPTIQLFMYNISGGLMQPCNTDTGLGFVTKSNVSPYLAHNTRFEGSGSAETAFAPPAKIAV